MTKPVDLFNPTMPSYMALLKAIEEQVPLAKVQKLYAAYVLERHGQNKVHASRRLEVDRRTIQRWGV